uniref:C4H2/CYP73A42 n=1 Tax=Arundo donax TaxID=35708 RepID=A0A0A9EF96_ARUDO
MAHLSSLLSMALVLASFFLSSRKKSLKSLRRVSLTSLQILR